MYCYIQVCCKSFVTHSSRLLHIEIRIRNKTINNRELKVDNRKPNIEHRTLKVEKCKSRIENRTLKSRAETRALNIEHRTSNIEKCELKAEYRTTHPSLSLYGQVVCYTFKAVAAHTSLLLHIEVFAKVHLSALLHPAKSFATHSSSLQVFCYTFKSFAKVDLAFYAFKYFATYSSLSLHIQVCCCTAKFYSTHIGVLLHSSILQVLCNTFK